MTGRSFGSRIISVDQIEKIVTLTMSKHSKKDIANAANCNPKTVYCIQNKLDLI